MNVKITSKFEQDYKYWLKSDKKIVVRILKLIESIKISPFSGIGKPEPLKYELQKCWSRRINYEHRLIYMILENEIILLSCRFHYSQ